MNSEQMERHVKGERKSWSRELKVLIEVRLVGQKYKVKY